MAEKQDNTAALEILFQTLEENPGLWETRRKTAELLFADERYLEAADILWNAPEIPATDIDVAFALKIIARVKPNRSIRLIYEVVRRNEGKPQKNLAVAKALNDIGMYMEAARFYGAALASDSTLFDLAFERQMLWLDDSGRLLEEWQKTDQASKPPLDVAEQEISGGVITPSALPEDTTAAAVAGTVAPSTPASPSPVAPLVAAVAPVAVTPAAPSTRPLMVAGGAPTPAGQVQTSGPMQAQAASAPAIPQAAAPHVASPQVAAPVTPQPASPVSTVPLAVAKPVQAVNPLLGANSPVKTQPLLTPSATTPSQKLMTPGAAAPTPNTPDQNVVRVPAPVVGQPPAAAQPPAAMSLKRQHPAQGTEPPAALPPGVMPMQADPTPGQSDGT